MCNGPKNDLKVQVNLIAYAFTKTFQTFKQHSSRMSVKGSLNEGKIQWSFCTAKLCDQMSAEFSLRNIIAKHYQ